MNHVQLQQWRDNLGLTKKQAAAILGKSYSRYIDMERGAERATGRITRINADTALACLYLIRVRDNFDTAADLLAAMSYVDDMLILQLDPNADTALTPKPTSTKQQPKPVADTAKPKFTYNRDVAEIRSNARIPEEIKQMAMRVEYE